MSFILKVVFVLLAGVLLGILAFKDPGYVLIQRSPWRVETSLAFLAVALVMLFGLLYGLLRLAAGAGAVRENLEAWRRARRARRARRSLTHGLIKLAERQWAAAEKELLRHVSHSDTPLLNYLAAANAAQGQGAHERRDNYLRLAHDSMPAADVAVGLTQAELQLQHQQMEQALATLTHLRQLAPRHAHVLKLLMTLYLELKDWHHLQALLPELRKRHVIDEAAYDALESRVYLEQLRSAIQSGVREVILQLWSRLPKRLRSHQDIVISYVDYLRSQGEHEEAERLLRDALNRQWSRKLVALYGEVQCQDQARQLKHAEKWLPEHENDPGLLLALGRICERLKLWGKARSYYESSLAIRASAEAYKALGDLVARVEQPGRSPLQYYQAGLNQALIEKQQSRKSAALPAPAGGKH